MKFENPFKSKETAFNKIIKNFEENLVLAKIDESKKPQDKYIGMKENELIALTQAVNALSFDMEELKNDSKTTNENKVIIEKIQELAKTIIEIGNINEMKKVFAERMSSHHEDNVDPYVFNPTAEDLQNNMQTLWVYLHKLKS